MCGITGIWSPGSDEAQLRAEVAAAVQALHHRGPDDHGIWSNSRGVALGHARLSILDLSQAGHQPMLSPDGRQAIVFNGEIYNYAEIKKQLVAAGHRFVGSGDTEVALHAFREWGPAAVDHFIGMFAIALWDEDSQTLQLYRDRVGVKPLYYGWDGRALCFGSELKALRAFGHWKPEISVASLGEYLQYAYISGERSIYRGICRLLPGHRLTLSAGRPPLIERYWDLTEHVGVRLPGSDRDLEAQLEELLVDACRYRMVSDVPVGVYLSGGVDSSLVTALLARNHPQKIRTFTIGSHESSHDESGWARKVARHCGTDHTDYILDGREALDLVQHWGDLFDEPFGDSSGIPTLLVSRLAREQVKVVLSADGGDELFSGYPTYPQILSRRRIINRLGTGMRHALSRGLSALVPDRITGGLISHLLPAPAPDKVFRAAKLLAAPGIADVMSTYQSFWYPEEVERLIGPYERPPWGTRDYPGSDVDQMSLRDFHHYLPDDILVKVDRTTMFVSIEGREPLLDHRLAEFALRLPDHLKQGSLGSKHILKSILYRHVPRELVDRPKQGFAIPLNKWFRSELRELLNDHLSDARIRGVGLMEPRLVQKILRAFDAGNDRLLYPLQLLLFFEMWRQRWM